MLLLAPIASVRLLLHPMKNTQDNVGEGLKKFLSLSCIQKLKKLCWLPCTCRHFAFLVVSVPEVRSGSAVRCVLSGHWKCRSNFLPPCWSIVRSQEDGKLSVTSRIPFLPGERAQRFWKGNWSKDLAWTLHCKDLLERVHQKQTNESLHFSGKQYCYLYFNKNQPSVIKSRLDFFFYLC